jgi:hypothetical protein
MNGCGVQAIGNFISFRARGDFGLDRFHGF